MTEQIKAFVPPLAVTKIIGTYTFEDGGFVAIVAGGKTPTREQIDMAKELLRIKEDELARRSEGTPQTPPQAVGGMDE